MVENHRATWCPLIGPRGDLLLAQKQAHPQITIH